MARTKRIVKSAARKVWQPLSLYPHQRAVVDAYKTENILRFFLAWHRRAGKDVFGLDFARERLHERIGSYWHLFPFHVQAKRAIWKGIDARTGQRFIDRAFPENLVESVNDTEMSITFKCGSTWQMLGSDNYDRLVGANPAGVLFSEFALCDPAAWDYIRPILVENKGWAAFITTFRGRNHAWRMYESLKGNPNWYVDLRTIEDTCRNDGSPIVTPADVEKEIAEGMSRSLAQQEFYCDPDASNEGAIFRRQHQRIMQCEAQQWIRNNRVVRVAWGMQDEGISAVIFQDRHIIGVHSFLEQNITDAAQIIARRYGDCVLLHHGTNLDPTLFGQLDGEGVMQLPQSEDEHMLQGGASAIMNLCTMSSAAREVLADFSLAYAPYRDTQDDSHLTHPSLMRALAVANTAQVLVPARTGARKPLNYSNYDRGVI